MRYYFSKTLSVPFDEAVERVTEELMLLFSIGIVTQTCRKASLWES